jgi:hypothetical protein
MKYKRNGNQNKRWTKLRNLNTTGFRLSTEYKEAEPLRAAFEDTSRRVRPKQVNSDITP